MKKKKNISLPVVIFICMCCISGIFWLKGGGQFESILSMREIRQNMHSDYAVLAERDSGRILIDKNGKKKMYPASLTKIMTVLLAVESISDDSREVVMTGSILDELRASRASMAGFVPGERLKLRDLYYGAMLPSGAECCLRLVRYLAGSEEKFAVLMNQKAREIGMKNTHFVNSTGLHDPKHVSTAEDIEILLRYALDNPRFRKVFQTMQYRTESTAQHSGGLLLNSTLTEYQSRLDPNNGSFLGGKTGYTKEAGLCLASWVKVKGKEYILVTAGARGDHQTRPFHVLDAEFIYQRL